MAETASDGNSYEDGNGELPYFPPRQFSQENPPDNKRKEERHEVSTVDTQCARDGCGSGGLEALILGLPLKQHAGKKCGNKNKPFRRREKSNGLIREDPEVSGCVIHHHQQK